MKILLTGGGTGGHTAPILAVADEIKKLKNNDVEFMLITPDDYFNESIRMSGIGIRKIQAGKLRRYFDLKNIIDIFKIAAGVAQSMYYIWKFDPDVAFSKGGFASVPAVFASWLLRIPVVTHESDITPGFANRLNSFFAARILVSFDETKKYFKKNKAVLTGNPIREDILKGSAEAGRRIFGISGSFPTLLIFGGSQGARRINEAVLDSLENLLKKFNVIHICGRNNFTVVKEAAENKHIRGIERYRPFPFLFNEMKDAYAVSDVIVSRAGANSIAEIIEVGRPSIIIPLSTSANDHQEKNAKWLLEKGLARVMCEKDLSGSKLLEEIVDLFESEKKERKISKNIIEYKINLKLKPAEAIAKTILESANLV